MTTKGYSTTSAISTFKKVEAVQVLRRGASELASIPASRVGERAVLIVSAHALCGVWLLLVVVVCRGARTLSARVPFAGPSKWTAGIASARAIVELW